MAWRDESRELREQVMRASNEATAILKAAKEAEGGRRDLTPEENEKVDRIHADIEAKWKTIERIERQGGIDDRLAASQGTMATKQDTATVAGADLPEDDEAFEDELNRNPPKRDQAKKESFLASWARWHAYKGGVRKLIGRNLKDEAKDAIEDHCIASRNGDRYVVEVDGVTVKAAMSGLSGPAGEYTIEDAYSSRIVEALKNWGGLLRSPIDRITTAQGNDIHYLLDDDSSGEGEIVEENQAVTEEDPTFGRATMKAYTISSKLVLVPVELLQDTGIDIEGYLNTRFARRIGRTLNKKCTIGVGAKEMTGIVTSAPVGKTAAGSTSVSYTEFLDLKHSVDPDYRADPSCGWGFNDATLLAFKKILDGTARPLWQASAIVGEPPTIDGDRYYINQSMPSMTTGQKAIIYGAFNYYLIRSVVGTSIVRLVERYAEKRQIGFFAFQRHDGQLLNAGGTNSPVKAMQMA